jgi:hypothetical protein
MRKRNPFSLNFGMIPGKYIERTTVTDEVVESLTDEENPDHCFMLTGLRGSGKTVTLTKIEKIIETYDDWVVVDLNINTDLLNTLVAKLYDTDKFVKEFVISNLNLSKFGIGVNIETIAPASDIESSLQKILAAMKKKGKKVLACIDEVSNTSSMKKFATALQTMSRKDYPLFLIMDGLYENISDLQNDKNLTFLYRTPKKELGPLNITLIKATYRDTFGISDEQAMQMAIITKGYAFAYQALGRYVWDEPGHIVNETVLAKFDETIGEYVYDKIWSELTPTEKWYLSFLVDKNTMKVSELLEITKKKKNEFSQYRSSLAKKGVIDTGDRGVIKLKLPRFGEYIKNKTIY